MLKYTTLSTGSDTLLTLQHLQSLTRSVVGFADLWTLQTHAVALHLGMTGDLAAIPPLTVALWLSLLPWLDDVRWLAKGPHLEGSRGGAGDSSPMAMAPGMEPVEEVLEGLQQHVLRLFEGQLGEIDGDLESSASHSSAAGGLAVCNLPGEIMPK